MSENEKHRALFGIPIVEREPEAFNVTGFEFGTAGIDALFGPLVSTPCSVYFDPSPRPTRRKMRLCQRTGHPRLGAMMRGQAVPTGMSEMEDGGVSYGFTLTNMAPVKFCRRCGVDVSDA
jgi:hypothetical protein